MIEPERRTPRERQRAAVLDGIAAGAIPGPGDYLLAVLAWLRAAIMAEAEQGRLAPWIAVSFCAGVFLYFIAAHEPSWLASWSVFAGLSALAFHLRERVLAFPLALAAATLAAGFTLAATHGAWVAHPVLTAPTATVTLEGFVASRDASARSDRIVLRVTKSDPKAKQKIPERIRLAFRKGNAPAVGEHVEMKARLRPLVGPVRPGGYDFAIGAYFSGLGATGFALGKSKPAPAASETPFGIRINARIEGMRRALADRIRLTLPGDAGAVAAALVTGIRDHISNDVNEALRVSGLYHVISISGLHMALIAAAIFALARGGLALIPGLALRRPIKKWAAALALIGVSFYLLLSGAEVATQRSYIMIAVVLVGVLIDRPALTLRTLSAAVVVTLLVSPEAVLNPGFQMSFAATLALVSFYERWAPLVSNPPATAASTVRVQAERAGRWLLLGAATSFVAGLATALYAAFHFHRLAPYGVLANVLSMPLIAFVIMPGALLGVALLPFGFDHIGWAAMGIGIDGMIWIAKWVAAIDGAEGRIAAFGPAAVLIGTAALLLIAIPATRIRLIGLPLAALALFLMWQPVRYDVLIDAEADSVAVRTADGKLSIYSLKSDRFTTENWLAAAGLPPADRATLRSAFSCDANGCIGRLADGALIAIPKNLEAVIEDCGRALLVIYPRDVPANCGAAVVDKRVLAAAGALALRKTPSGWDAIPSRAPNTNRPWFGRANAPDAGVFARLTAKRKPKDTTPIAPPEELSGEIPTPEVPEAEPDDQ